MNTDQSGLAQAQTAWSDSRFLFSKGAASAPHRDPVFKLTLSAVHNTQHRQ
eukprot:m.846499 g.846499  ORF g.846499 m.846499 type:complete len:51 (-) comp59560_c0_seq10:2229-2381(-)